MIAVTYRILLHEPLLVTHLEGEPNSKVSLPYLPGAVLRGAVVAAWARSAGVADLAGDPQAAALFFSGRVRFLNGYPVAQEQPSQRCLPTPRSWREPKGADGNSATIYDFAASKFAVGLPDDDWEENIQWNSVAGRPFRTPRGQDVEEVLLLTPEQSIHVHTTRDRQMGRPTEDEGQVFRYQALAANQVFAAATLCETIDKAAEISRLLTAITALGGARNAGYGRVEVTADSIDQADEEWREYDLCPPALGDTRLVVTLLSDALLRDGNGQAVVRLDAMEAAIRRAIPGAALVDAGSEEASRKRAFFSADLCGGFNRKWGLPLPQMPAFAMGSVFLFDAPDCTPEQVAELERDGIGERRTEGFGRVGVTSYVEPEFPARRSRSPLKSLTASPLTSTSRDVARNMADRLLMQRLERQIRHKSAHYKIGKPPKASQIARLRGVLLAELLKEPSIRSVEPITRSLGSLQSHARSQYARAAIDNRPLDEWIRRICASTTSGFVSQTLAFNPGDGVTLGAVRSSLLNADGGLTDSAATECAIRFLDAVLARAAKADKQEGDD